MKTYNDVFVEEMVKRSRPGFTLLIRAGSVVLAIVLIIVFYYFSGLLLGEYAGAVFPILFVAVWVGVFMAFRFLSLEYEYSFYSGDVDIEKIIGKRKRSAVLSFSCKDIEIMAPYGPKYEELVGGQFQKTLDVRGTGKGQRDWFIICRSQSGKRTVMAFSPSDRMLDAFRMFVKGGRFKEE